MPKFDIEVTTEGWGDARFIFVDVEKAIRKAGATTEQVNEWYDEAMAGDYDHVLRTAMNWVKVA
jgi:hypothetical protein